MNIGDCGKAKHNVTCALKNNLQNATIIGSEKTRRLQKPGNPHYVRSWETCKLRSLYCHGFFS